MTELIYSKKLIKLLLMLNNKGYESKEILKNVYIPGVKSVDQLNVFFCELKKDNNHVFN